MTSALTRKSYRELTRHRIRSILTIITIAATVTGLWLFAIPLGLDAAMAQRMETDLHHDIRLSPDNLIYVPDPAQPPPADAVVTAAELDGLRALPNIEAVEARPVMRTQMRRGSQTEDIWLVGVEDFADQQVNIVSAEEGDLPATTPDAHRALLDAPATQGEQISIKAGDGKFYPFTVSGSGGTIRWNGRAGDIGEIVYVPAETVRLFAGSVGFNSLELRLVDTTVAATKETLGDARAYLDSVAPAMTYWEVPEISDPGSWYGRDRVFRLVPLLYVIAFTALASALILVSTTMNTIVSQQTVEIGVMKAIGGSRRTIMACYLRSVLLLGGIGTAIGTAAGALMSDKLGRFVQEELGGIRALWSTDPWFLIVGVAAGLGGTALAALPALRRAMRVTVHQALGNPGAANGHGRGIVERATGWATFLSSPTRLGLRNAARRCGRSLATSLQVALGVGTVLAFGAFSITALAVAEDTLAQENSDLRVYHQIGLIDDEEARRLASLPGIAAIQPIVHSEADFGGDSRQVRGLPAETIYDPDLSAGRWFTDAEVSNAAPVGVIGGPLATMTHTDIGDFIEIGTANGVHTIQVVGIDENLVHEGTFIWLPLETAKVLAGQRHPNVYWVETTSPDAEAVDRVASAIAATFQDNPVKLDARYRTLAAAKAEDRVMVGVIQAFSLPIVAIGMIGLVSAMTTTVLERTKEIGILRAIGARRRHIRRVFRTEGVALAAVGWLIGIPVGYVLAKVILWFFGRAMHTSLPLLFPPWLPLITLVGVIAVARLTLRPPLRRAVRMRPGDALRYE